MSNPAMPKTVKLNDLNPKALFCIRGRLSYSRLAKHIEGQELENDKKRRLASGRRPIDRPYTTATICNARVLFKNPQAEQNPALRSLEETYAVENLYQSQSANNPGWSFNAVNKSRNLPAIFVFNKESGKYERITLTGELDGGLDVTLVMRVFRSKEQGNNGISLDQICINEPVRYYSGGVDLSEYGIIIDDTVHPDEPAAAAPTAPMQAPVQAPVQPTVAPAAQPIVGGFTAPQPAAPVVPQQMPYQAPAPVGYPQAAPVAPAAPAPSAFGAYPQQPVAPVAPGAPAPGINYDPTTDPSRQY